MTVEEVGYCVVLVAQLDENRYSSPAVKSVILKCKSIVVDKPEHLWIGPH